MNFPLTLLFTILFVSFSHLILHSSSAMEKLEDTGNTKMESLNLKVKSFADQGDHVQRKHLHEVHSGPNPVSNSVPLRKWKTRHEIKNHKTRSSSFKVDNNSESNTSDHALAYKYKLILKKRSKEYSESEDGWHVLRDTNQRRALAPPMHNVDQKQCSSINIFIKFASCFSDV